MRVSERWKRESEESGKMWQQKQRLEWRDCWLWRKGPWAKECHSLWKLEKSGKQILRRASDTLILVHWVHFELLTSRTVKICVPQSVLWCWEGLGARGEGDDREWDGWTASLTRWTWVWVNSGRWWWTGRPGVQFMGSQRVGHDWATELNWDFFILAQSTIYI